MILQLDHIDIQNTYITWYLKVANSNRIRKQPAWARHNHTSSSFILYSFLGCAFEAESKALVQFPRLHRIPRTKLQFQSNSTILRWCLGTAVALLEQPEDRPQVLLQHFDVSKEEISSQVGGATPSTDLICRKAS